ncbi:hypothetical protein [Mycobacterium paraterrae]|uniref:Uncharacterized protein n=1 Tax=Mycobacterium paraterrae TaxID=577492 RepID=A0ABY5U6W8_9MYCO|nr:hypothetical protein [Mycobacterium paraterrae]UWI82308.1 hypothetical protein MKK62_26385 [Mycobacterium paraterrae]
MMRVSVLNMLLVPEENEIEFAENSEAFAQRAKPPRQAHQRG